MAIGLTAQQKAQLAAMLPNIDDSVASLKRLITDAKDRTRALAKLAEAEEAQKRHARDVGVPFNADAFATRRAELDALPKTLTVEDGQLSAFVALGRAIGVITEGPYVREAGRGGARGTARGAAKQGGPRKAAGQGKSPVKKAAAGAPRGKANARPASQVRPAAKKHAGRPALVKSEPTRGQNAPAPAKRVKPLPLALGS